MVQNPTNRQHFRKRSIHDILPGRKRLNKSNPVPNKQIVTDYPPHKVIKCILRRQRLLNNVTSSIYVNVYIVLNCSLSLSG